MAAALKTIDDLEVLAIMILEKGRKKVEEKDPVYTVMPASKGADMLDWKKPVEVQDIKHGFWRVGAIGDGNCLLHSFMTAASPTYRKQNMTTRQYIVDQFRKVLEDRIEEIADQLDILYFSIGGAMALADSLEIIRIKRDEIGLDVAPAIARLYGMNFLAIALDDSLKWRPFCQTRTEFNPELPTMLIHYMGAGANFAEGEHGFMEAGHYEVILRPIIEEVGPAGGAGRASTRRATAAADTVQFDEVRTSYIMRPGDLDWVMGLFDSECGAAGKYVHPMEREGGPRRTASGRIIPGSSPKRTASGHSVTRKASSGRKSSSGTRKAKTSSGKKNSSH
jgi:hypothetical protein